MSVVMSFAAISHNFMGSKKIVRQSTHFHLFCLNFNGKDEVFHGLLCHIVVICIRVTGRVVALLVVNQFLLVNHI